MLRSLPPLPQTPTPGSPLGEAPPLDLDEAYRRYAGQVARWAERLAGPRADLEDLVHDVFVVAQRRRREWRGDAKLSTWLYEITIRVVQGRRRASRRWRFLAFIERDAEAGFPAQALPFVPAPTPIELLEQRLDTALLYELLDTLGEKYRTALILFELEGLSGREIAALTNTSLANVWMRIVRARSALTKRLQAHLARQRPAPHGKAPDRPGDARSGSRSDGRRTP